MYNLYIIDTGQVGRQIHRRTVVQSLVSEYGDFELNALCDMKPLKTGECILDVF